MVLGLRSKNKKGIAVQTEYTVHVQEIKPWPPSQSLKSLRSVVLQWENGDQASGSGSHVAPSLLEQRIVFNESFNLHVTLQKEIPSKGTDGGAFQKNILELNLYEIRREKAVKGQHLGSANVDLAEYGVVQESVSITVPVNCKRSFRNSVQPVLNLTIRPLKKVESVSSSVRGDVGVEEEISSFTDDDSSSARGKELDESSRGEDFKAESSSLTTNQSNSDAAIDEFPESKEQEKINVVIDEVKREDERAVTEERGDREECSEISESFVVKSNEDNDGVDGNSNQGGSNEEIMHVNEDPKEIEASENDSVEIRCVTLDPSTESQHPDSLQSQPAFSQVEQSVSTQSQPAMPGQNQQAELPQVERTMPQSQLVLSTQSQLEDLSQVEQTGLPQSKHTFSTRSQQADLSQVEKTGTPESQLSFSHQSQQENLSQVEQTESPKSQPALFHQSQQEDLSHDEQTGPPESLQIDSQIQQTVAPETQRAFSPQIEKANLPQSMENGHHRHLKSVRSSSLLSRSDNSLEEVKEIHVLEQPRNRETSFSYRRKVNELESKVKLLEAELREAAAVEVGLYSVVAEHGSSVQKVNAPARRLLRLYDGASGRSGSAARSAISGLILVAKACGNDVTRLTFWLSNIVVLRAVLAKRVELSDVPESNGKNQESNPLRWNSLSKGEEHLSSLDDLADWEDSNTFILALEKIEAWIFSRIVESLWWQTLTPHMQSPGQIHGRRNCYSQMSFSIDLWKKAFKDVSERLCPVRAEGHQCGCLPVLLKLIMDQCVTRLDVAMFNAILRESAEDIPTDPISDPIMDTRVLPVPAGKSSFGAGAQLKNTIGNWCRGITDWFSTDDEEEEKRKHFRLLNALSDLLMLPKDMLLDQSIRREVCPTFAAPILKRILTSFEPDEFCSDAVPKELLDMLDSEDEDLADVDEKVVSCFPCAAAEVVYLPPEVAMVADIIGDSCLHGKNNSAVLRKSNTSDDELDELDSPLKLVNAAQPSLTSQQLDSGSGLIRYQLLREVWRSHD